MPLLVRKTQKYIQLLAPLSSFYFFVVIKKYVKEHLPF